MRILLLVLLAGCGTAKFESVVKRKNTTPAPITTPTPTPCVPIVEDDPAQSDNPSQNGDD